MGNICGDRSDLIVWVGGKKEWVMTFMMWLSLVLWMYKVVIAFKNKIFAIIPEKYYNL